MENKNRFHALVESMKKKGLISVKEPQPEPTSTQIQALKMGMTDLDFNKLCYQKRLERARRRGMTPGQLHKQEYRKTMKKRGSTTSTINH